jgi:hypothetical protein
MSGQNGGRQAEGEPGGRQCLGEGHAGPPSRPVWGEQAPARAPASAHRIWGFAINLIDGLRDSVARARPVLHSPTG